jgi:hypothetical protein
MTADGFRRMALALPEALESSHHDHPDFRVRGRIFATLGYPTAEWAVVIVSPSDQRRLSRGNPAVFVPVGGAWGRAGSTQVRLARAPATSVREALKAAWAYRSAPTKRRARTSAKTGTRRQR